MNTFLFNNNNNISKVTGAKSSSVKPKIPRIADPTPFPSPIKREKKSPLDRTHRGSYAPLRRPTLARSGPLGPQTFDREYVSQSGWGAADHSATTQFASTTAQAREGGVSATDALRYDGADDNVTLSKFLSRPVKIREFTWKEGDALREYAIYPWKEFLRTPEIARKIANYAWISGTMNIQVLVNGTQFHYGKSMLSWRPLTRSGTELIRAPGNADFIDNVRFSQRLNVTIDPTECEAGTMQIPFIWHKTYLDLNFDQELENIGELILSSYNELQNAQTGSTTPKDVNITLMAYLTGVTLTGATDFTYQSQAGKTDEYDEGNKGVISTPASAVAKAAGALKSIPMIAPYATATEMGANAISSIAKHFGYSTPNNLEPRHTYKAKPMGEMANVIGTSTVDKLSFDPKQELSIDPRISGYEPMEDEMNILSLVQRESYIGRFAWGFGNLTESELFRSLVTPVQYQTENIPNVGVVRHLTPMCAIAQMFQYWRGSIEYRFEIAASKFHKGRLRVVYEPYDQTIPDQDYPAWAGPYSRVIDLSEQRSFSLKVGMNQNLPFLSTEDVQGTGNTTPDDGTFPTLVTLNSEYGVHNGTIRVFVLNQLTSPEEVGPAVQINVFARMCDDAEFGAPGVNFTNLTSVHNASYVPLSATGEQYISQSAPSEDKATPDNTETTAELPVEEIVPTQKIDSIMLTHFGESITSLRCLLKRYNNFITLKAARWGTPGGPTEVRMFYTDFPYYNGDGIVTLDSGPPPKVTSLNYVTPFFAARRGGVRWKHVYQEMPKITPGADAAAALGMASNYRTISATRLASDWNFAGDRVKATDISSNGQEIDAKLDTQRPLSMYAGASISPIEVNPAVEIELPFYSNKRFAFGTTNQVLEVQGQIGRNSHIVQFNQNLTDDATPSYVRSYVAAGEDFSLSAFVCIPPMVNQTI